MAKHDLHKLGLGTVQFGLDYGISNQAGRIMPDEVEKILVEAAASGVTMLDTAHLYGESEDVIGQSLSNAANLDARTFNIVTKTIPIRSSEITPENIRDVDQGVRLSLERLNQSQLYGILLHDANDLKSKNADALFDYLKRLREDGLVKKIGVSVYDEEQVTYIQDRFPIDLIQIPLNVFDQRLINSGTLKTLSDNSVEVHVRSAFLQGIIFMKPSDLPAHLSAFAEPLKAFQEMANEHNVSFAAVALAFLTPLEGVHKVVCGVNSLTQFNNLVEDVCSLPHIEYASFAPFSIEDPKLVNPAHW